MKWSGLFHFISTQGDGYKIPGLPGNKVIPWGWLRKFGFWLVLREIFQAIWIENPASVHHKLMEADNSRSRMYSSGLLPGSIWAVCEFSRATLNNQNLYSSSCILIFWNCLMCTTVFKGMNFWRVKIENMPQISKDYRIWWRHQHITFTEIAVGSCILITNQIPKALLWRGTWTTFPTSIMMNLLFVIYCHLTIDVPSVLNSVSYQNGALSFQ